MWLFNFSYLILFRLTFKNITSHKKMTGSKLYVDRWSKYYYDKLPSIFFIKFEWFTCQILTVNLDISFVSDMKSLVGVSNQCFIKMSLQPLATAANYLIAG